MRCASAVGAVTVGQWCIIRCKSQARDVAAVAVVQNGVCVYSGSGHCSFNGAICSVSVSLVRAVAAAMGMYHKKECQNVVSGDDLLVM